ncbi:PREDICTED: forkhead box protein A4-A-like [Bactrocera latifrons]|uniref:forkhead box protein A4-A-like n=1 Tax=Bactrocera latifrons TaxID=174628 RepID=UPI0008DCC2CB|nr:PREDICTED: forkhead box protein A4-A-like [Bactrocera latifrons]
MSQHFESNFSIRNLLANEDGINPALTPPPSDRSKSRNELMSPDKDNCGSRPNYSYSELITMAIRSSTEGKLTSNAIQNWISEKFPYYRKEEHGWQNRLKQTLSTSSCFCKIRRPINDPGRGCYWAISPEEGALQAQQPVDGSEAVIGAIVNGVSYPQAPNAVYFPSPQEMQEAHQTMLVQALQEQETWYQYHLEQAQLIEQMIMALRQQQFQQQYEEMHQQLESQKRQITFLTDQQISA